MAAISQNRLTQIETTSKNFLTSFNQPFSESYTQQDFLQLFDPSAEWIDHAFHIRRVGHEAILGLRKAFLHCNQPFKSEIKTIVPTADGATTESLWVGRCTNGIVRPDGEVAVKGTGRDFRTHVCMLLKLDDQGRITRIDEYYTKLWDTGVEETNYVVVKGVHSKD